MKPPTLAESQAARIVAACTDCLYEQLDPGGGSDQLPDFELRDARQHRIGVLEVTSTAAEDYRTFESARLKHKILDSKLRFSWFIVTKSASISVKQLAEALPALLVQAEGMGLTPKLPFVLTPGFNYLAGEEPHTSLANLGVWILSALPTPKSMAGRVNIKPPAQGGSFGPELVTEVIQRELELEDNLAKLRTAGVSERAELFVWLEFDQAGMALVTPRITPGLGLPTEGPVLPEGITRVWAATEPNDADVLARALWMAEGEVWNVIPSPPRLH